MIRKLVVVLLTGVFCLLGVTSVLAVTYNEAPMLKTMVAAGELPPVEERLPEEPQIIEVVEEVGQYGGIWRRAWTGTILGLKRLIGEELITVNLDGSKLLPCVAKSWEVSEGMKVFTFYLRKGMKWSDGASFTADDFVFLYEDVLLNEELTPVFPATLMRGKKPVEMEKVDDYTVRFRFAEAYSFFLWKLAHQAVAGMADKTFLPKHYLKKFHPRYTSKEELDKLVRESGLTSWAELFNIKLDNRSNPERPVVTTWKLKTPVDIPVMIMERNPYYWKVDPVGNQLPYVDRVVFTLCESIETLNLKALAGELDGQLRRLMVENYSLFVEGAEKGDYRVLLWPTFKGTDYYLTFNQTYDEDPGVAKFLKNKEFRIALSLALNREEMNQIMFFGRAIPRQDTVIQGSVGFREEYATQYTEYDPERANVILDRIGLDKKDAQGFRLRPDGKRLELELTVQERCSDCAELLCRNWREVGVKAEAKVRERTLLYMLQEQNKLPISMHWGTVSTYPNCLISDINLVPLARGARLAALYGLWYETEGKEGLKPTGDFAKVIELYDKFGKDQDEEKRQRYFSEIVRINAENLWSIGTVLFGKEVVVVKNNFRNWPETAHVDWTLLSIKNCRPEQFFFKQK